MKLKINKACDLSSISVLPPQSRRSNVIGAGTDTSVFGKAQASQMLRSQQQSQQSFSQGMSSQLSQNSFDEILTNDQKYGSQGENSTRRTSCLAPVAYSREETPMPLSRSSNNQLRRWGSVPVQDHRCQVSEELEHRIGMIETSLNRFGMILDSVQGDVMQVNKAIKEVSLETEGIRKKLATHDSSLQLMLKGEEDIKASLEGSLKSIPDQLRKELHQYKLQETASTLSSLPNQIETQLLKLQCEISGNITKKLEAIISSIKLPNIRNVPPTPLPQTTSYKFQPQKEQLPVMRNPVVPANPYTQRQPVPKIKAESPGFINPKQTSFSRTQQDVKQKKNQNPVVELDREWRVILESDEEIDVGFSCLFQEKETGTEGDPFDDVTGETQRILRKARRRKRKHCNSVILI